MSMVSTCLEKKLYGRVLHCFVAVGQAWAYINRFHTERVGPAGHGAENKSAGNWLVKTLGRISVNKID